MPEDPPKVVRLDGSPVEPEGDYNHRLVDSLQDLIAGVKQGRIVGVGLALVGKDETLLTSVWPFVSQEKGECYALLLAAASRLERRVHECMDANVVSDGSTRLPPPEKD